MTMSLNVSTDMKRIHEHFPFLVIVFVLFLPFGKHRDDFPACKPSLEPEWKQVADGERRNKARPRRAAYLYVRYTYAP